MTLMFLLCLSLTGPQAPAPEPSLDAEFLELTDEMKAFLDHHVGGISDHTQRLNTLVHIIFSEKLLNLEYDNSRTRTAGETFEARSGNCISFTAMFVSMARYLGIDAQFQEVTNFPTWNRNEGIVVLNMHMNAAVSINGRPYVMDFNPYAARKERNSKIVSDDRARGHYFNNLGAEFFAKRNYNMALPFFERAVEIAPDLSFAWSNLGVAYAKTDREEEAEAAYKHAIELNRDEYTSMANLARLYVRQGRGEEAAFYESKIESFRKRNPYYHFFLGEQAYNKGDYEASVKHFKSAIRRKEKEHEFHFALAKTYAQLDDHRHVERSLKKARKYAPDVFDQNRYSQKLEMLSQID